MDKRFTYLVVKYLDNDLSLTEKTIFEKYLGDPACRKYFEDAEKIEKIMKEGFRILNEKAAGAVGSRQSAGGKAAGVSKKDNKSAIRLPKSEINEDDIPDEIKEDVRLYGGKDDPVAREAVKRMHAQMIRHRRTTFLLKYALPLAGMIASLVYIWSNFIKPLPGTLYMAQFKPYEFAVISPATEPDERTRTAMSMYKSGDYKGSSRLCNEIIVSGTYESDIHFLYGMNLMSLDSMLRAIKEFDAYISGPPFIDSNRQRPVYWYKGLCYLKLGRPVPALLSMMEPYYLKFKKKTGK